MNSLPILNNDATSETTASQLAIMVTRRCNMTCAHCSVESSPKVRTNPEEADLLRWVRQSAEAGVRSILFTGGEPMIREALVLRLMHEAKRLGVRSSMTSNGFWGKTIKEAKSRLIALREAGLDRLTVSYDRYHAEFQGPEPALNIARASEELNFDINISITRVANDGELEQIVSPFRNFHNVRLRFYDVQPVGNARNFSRDSLRAETEGFCSACDSPAITDDGRMTACNGPSYFMKSPSPLFIGSLNESSVGELAKRHRQDPVLDTIRTFGPGRLRDELKTISGFEDFPFRDQYHGMCELCHHVTGDPDAVAALRERLADPQQVAQRFAMQRVMNDSKRSGSLNRNHVNGIGASRVFFRAADFGASPLPPESRLVLGRADIDWNELADYLTICGLARPLLPALEDPELRRWAPKFFLDGLRHIAISDGMRELIQREILRRLSKVLSEVGTTGVLLKGGAMLALHNPNDTDRPQTMRSGGDIDIHVRPDRAAEVRAKLLQAGFHDTADRASGNQHHLAPLIFQGVPLEIHTRLMPAQWKLPEREMLERAIPLPEGPFRNLSTLDPEGMLLHTTVHVSHHVFSFGLKTAWDIRWLVRNYVEMDWDRLARWAGSQRGFWVPLVVMCRELEIPLPVDFLSLAPADLRQRKLEWIAEKRLFKSQQRWSELNRFNKTGLFFLMKDSWFERMKFLAQVAAQFTWRRLRRMPKRKTHSSPRNLRQDIRQSISDWRRIRRLPR